MSRKSGRMPKKRSIPQSRVAKLHIFHIKKITQQNTFFKAAVLSAFQEQKNAMGKANDTRDRRL